jgi:hypothetical protein
MTFRSGATFSDDMKYRYRLWRHWDDNIQAVLFILLNPSTADEWKDDPTVARCVKRARNMGFGGIEVCNLYGLRATDPSELYVAGVDPVGPENLSEINIAATMCSAVICGWGTHGEKVLKDWPVIVRRVLRDHGAVMALGFNDGGSPKHPLYLRDNVEPVEFKLGD